MFGTQPPCHTRPELQRDPEPSADGSSRVQWLVFLGFVGVSALLFSLFFEWGRYEIIAAPRGRDLAAGEVCVLFWLIVAKSFVWFVPLLPVLAVMIHCGTLRSAAVVLNIWWIIVFYFMAVDLVSVSFMGNHIWDYLPYLEDIINSPRQKLWQWAGEAFTAQVLLVLAIFGVSGPVCYFSVRWVTVRLAKKFPWLTSRRALIGFALLPALAVAAVLPAISAVQDRNLLDRVFPAMPLTTSLRESLDEIADDLAEWLRVRPKGLVTAGLSVMAPPLVHGSSGRSTSLNNVLETDAVGFPSLTLEDGSFVSPGAKGSFGWNRPSLSEPFTLGKLNDDLFLKPIGHDLEQFSVGSGVAGSRQAGSHEIVDESAGSSALAYLREAYDPSPADLSAYVAKKPLPNVILIILESFRHSAVSPELMKGLHEWSQQGLRLERHYSGSNCSHLGLFSLFYGRSALGFHRTLDRGIPSQMLESLRRSGYQISFLTAGEIEGFRRIYEFLNDKSCHNVIMEGKFSLEGMNNWPDSDRRILARARSIVNEAKEQPQFVFFYLLSSHYRYPCPPEFESFKESPSVWQFFDPENQIKNHLGRYGNSMRFLDHEVMDLIRSIDPKRNLVIITGDHGESMGEDGVFIHASRMSDIQLRVPCIMVGPGITPRVIRTATGHSDILPTLLHALAGKPVPVANCQGRDLIGDLAPADEIVVTRPKWPEWDGLLLVRGDKRMLFKANIAASHAVPSVEFAGLLDEWGQYELKIDRSARHTLRISD
jgi:hypothetical protein